MSYGHWKWCRVLTNCKKEAPRFNLYLCMVLANLIVALLTYLQNIGYKTRGTISCNNNALPGETTDNYEDIHGSQFRDQDFNTASSQ
jgi:hypothetical protein